MRERVVFLVVTFLLIGGNIYRIDGIVTNTATNNFVAACNENIDYTPVQQFICESDNGMPAICEKNNFSCRVISVVVRKLPVNTLFKVIHTKHIIKNKFFIRKAVVNSYFSRKQHDGYYTYILGYLRI